MRLPRMLEPLRIRDFALLWTGMSCSLVGDFMFYVALAWQTYELSNSPVALGWVSASYTSPIVAFLLVGGVLTDRMDRRRMMIAADLIRAAAIGTAGALAIAGVLQLWQLALLAAFAGLGDALFAPAFGSIVPEIVPRELLPQANSLDQFMRPAAGLVGPALAGILIASWGAGAALVADAATFGASAATAFALTPRPFVPSRTPSVRRELREGLAFVRRHTWLWGTFIAGSLMNLASAARNVLLPFIIKNELHASARALGVVYSATAAGALISSFAYGQRGVPRRHVLVMYVGWGSSLLMIAAYGLATRVWQLVVLAFVAGLGLAVGQAIWVTMMHRIVPREMLGRVTSFDYMTSMSLMPVCSALVGFVAGGIGVRTTLVGAGLISGGMTLFFLFALPGLRASERDGSMSSDPLGEPAGQGTQS